MNSIRLLLCFFFLTMTSLVSAQMVVEESTATILIAGDVIPHSRVKKAAYENGEENEKFFGTLLEQVRPLVSSADLAFANLETPIVKSELTKSGPFIFSGSVDLVHGLQWLGFDLVSVANNHMMDQKAQGLSETLVTLKKQGMDFVGAGETRSQALGGRIFEVRGIKIGFVAFTDLINGGTEKVKSQNQPYVNLLERSTELKETLMNLKKKVDVLFVSLHWGQEYESHPRIWQKNLAAQIHSWGADVIVGHHPHVLQDVESQVDRKRRRHLTFYSLGNLISNQSREYRHGESSVKAGNPRDGILARIHITKSGVKTWDYFTLWTDNWDGPEEGVRTVLVSTELGKVREQLNTLKPSPQRSFLLAREKLLLDRSDGIYRTLFNQEPPKIWVKPLARAKVPQP